jgi:hypothetical protein
MEARRAETPDVAIGGSVHDSPTPKAGRPEYYQGIGGRGLDSCSCFVPTSTGRRCYTCHTYHKGYHVSVAERFGAPERIRLVEFSVFNTPPRPSLMAILKGYMDDSQQDHVWAVGGYVSNDGGWQEYEHLWCEMLKRHNVPYFHMKEMGQQDGVYKHWHPREWHQSEVDLFFKDATKIIHDCRLHGVWSIVRKNDLDRFNREFGLQLEPYSLAAYGCLNAISWLFADVTVEMIFDHCDKIDKKLYMAREYAISDRHFGGAIKNNIACLPLPKKYTFRNVLALQCADYLAWEFRKDHFKIQEWYSIGGKPDDLVDRQQHFIEWSAQNYIEPWRKSLGALMAEGRVFGTTWDYESLVDENAARGGVWAPS